jgi:uncharacterized protein (DUF1800 family)
MPLNQKPLPPEEAWLPFEPTAAQPFGRREAAHLYRRAGFGANSRELDETVKLGPKEAAKKLVEASEGEFAGKMHTFAQTVLATNNSQTLAAWWLHRMLHTPAPLLEKTTLFWHSHFASSSAKVKETRLMFNQNELLRRYALGKFEPLVLGIARDPAMLIYLDSATNRKTHPNENFAREVMELFVLGIGNYTEKDIQEVARCFTGWEIQYGEFKFNRYQHDFGSKTVLGKSGNFDGGDSVKVLLEQPAAARFLCGKLARYFITDESDLSPEMIEPLAQKLRASDYTFAPVLEMLLASRLFYSQASVGKKVRSPVELGIGILRSLEATAGLPQIAEQIRELGQMPLFPPNVKGWPGGLAWINSSTLLGRANFVRQLVQDGNTLFGGVTLEAYIDKLGWKTADQVVDGLSELLLAVPLPKDVRSQLVAQIEGGNEIRLNKLKKTVHTLGSLPEFQMA